MAFREIVKITDPAEIAAGKEWKQAAEELQDEAGRLLARHEQEKQDWLAKQKRISRTFFRRVTGKHLSDPDEAFNTGSHFVDFSFVDFGDLFLLKAVKPTPEGEAPAPEEPDGPKYEVN